MVKGKLLELKNYLEEMHATSGRGTHTEWQLERAMQLADGAIEEAEAKAKDYKMQEVREQHSIVMAQLVKSLQAMEELGQNINKK